MKGRTYCPKENIGRVFGTIILLPRFATLEGSIISSDVCIVIDGYCSTHIAPLKEVAA
jgi:hypothetical protein